MASDGNVTETNRGISLDQGCSEAKQAARVARLSVDRSERAARGRQANSLVCKGTREEGLIVA